MPYIYVDPVVAAYLREHTALGDTYNAIIRNHLGLPAAPAAAESAATAAAAPGALMPLITAGKISAGDTLTWHRPRRGEAHTVTIDEAGRLVTRRRWHLLHPDTRASAIAGHPCKGWPNWQTATGASLQQLRDQAPTAR